MKKLIYSQEDLDLILSLETQEKDKEIDRLNNEIVELNIKLEDRAYEQIKFQWKDYKSRIDKAIEYIDKYLEREYFDTDILETNTIYNRDLFKVKKILQGDDKK